MISTRLQADDVKRQASGLWAEILPAVGGCEPSILDGKNHPCPKCGGTDRFRMIDPEAGALYCNQCFATGNGDGLAAVQWLRGVGFKDALHLVADHLGMSNGKPSSRIVAEYPYNDENGNLVFHVVRFAPKTFRQRAADGSWKVKGLRIVPYRLPELLSRPDDVVFVVEGEKDVDRLAAVGILATCNAGGAGKWRKEHSEFLRGRAVVILPDNDEAGRDHAESVARSLVGVAGSTKIVELPGLPPKGDVSDWLDAGGAVDDLWELVERAAEWKPTAEPDRQDDWTNGSESCQITSGDDRPPIPPLEILSFAQLREAYPKLREPIIDGICREGETVNVIAATKVGKSWLSMDLAMSIALGRKWLGQFETRQGRVLLIDNELHPESLSGRLESVRFARNHDADELDQAFDVVSLRGKVENLNRLALQLEEIAPGHYTAIIVDAFYRTLPSGTSESDNAAMTELYNVIDRLADRLKCVFIIVHHASKGAQGDKSVTDVGSGAGSMSRATDTHLVIRPHEEQGYAVLEAAVRSFPPMDPLTIYYKHPVWEISSLEAKVASSKTRAAEQRKADDAQTTAILREIMGNGGSWTVGKLHKKTGISEPKVARLLLAMKNELETTRKKCVSNGKRCEFYRLKPLSNQVTNLAENQSG